jgi:hypothetical protein
MPESGSPLCPIATTLARDIHAVARRRPNMVSFQVKVDFGGAVGIRTWPLPGRDWLAGMRFRRSVSGLNDARIDVNADSIGSP